MTAPLLRRRHALFLNFWLGTKVGTPCTTLAVMQHNKHMETQLFQVFESVVKRKVSNESLDASSSSNSVSDSSLPITKEAVVLT